MASRSAILRPAFASSTAVTAASGSTSSAGSSSAAAAFASRRRSAGLSSASHRAFSLSSARRAEADDADDADGASKAKSPFKTWLGIKNETLRAWFKSEEGERFKWPKEGAHNWIGGDRPYTANPYFNPTPPLSADLQDEMYAVYASFPAAVGAIERVALISEKYNISKDRVTAAVKTGQVAETWKEAGLAPQNAFVRGMEDVLLVPRHRPGNSDALAAFPTYLGSRIDLERDLETAKLARGEILRRAEDSGFTGDRRSYRLPKLSWELAPEGEIALSSKMALEKPLRPPRELPEFPSRIIAPGRSQAVTNVVDVGDKFRGKGWDGKIRRAFGGKESGQGYPGKQNALRRFVPLLTRQIQEQHGVVPLTKSQKSKKRVAAREALNAKGELTPTQQTMAKAHPGGVFDPKFIHKADRNNQVFEARLAAREAKALKRRATYADDLASAKDEFQQMIRDRISGKI